MKPKIQRQICGKVLLAAQRQADSYDARLRTSPLWAHLIKKYTRIRSEVLEKYVERDCMELPAKRFILLEPSEGEEFVSVATFSWDFEVEPAKLSFRALLYSQDSNYTGFRFEAAEATGKSRPYCHAQLTSRWSAGGSGAMEGGPLFWPETRPAFPLFATSPINLLLTALVTIYGANKVWRDIVESVDRMTQDNIRKSLKEPFEPSPSIKVIPWSAPFMADR